MIVNGIIPMLAVRISEIIMKVANFVPGIYPIDFPAQLVWNPSLSVKHPH
jgi:hypothetical protein